MKQILLTILMILSLTACQTYENNTAEQLCIGMTRQQVMKAIGQPTGIKEWGKNKEEWIYYQGESRIMHCLEFEEDALINYIGDCPLY